MVEREFAEKVLCLSLSRAACIVVDLVAAAPDTRSVLPAAAAAACISLCSFALFSLSFSSLASVLALS